MEEKEKRKEKINGKERKDKGNTMITGSGKLDSVILHFVYLCVHNDLKQ